MFKKIYIAKLFSVFVGVITNKQIVFIYCLLLASISAKTQNNSLVINGAYLVLNGGSFTSNIQLVVNQGNQNGIIRNSGHIITESQYNYIRWKTGATAGNYVFPTGYSTTDYLPVTLNKTTTTTADIRVSTWATPTNNLPFADSSAVAACTGMNSLYGGTAIGTVVDRWWDIVSPDALTADVTFNYRGAENTTTNPAAILNAQRWNGADWMLPQGAAPGVTTGIGALTVSGVSQFSPYVLVNSGGVLPIELISFTGKCENNSVYLNWTTVTETNNNFFTIEKSTDAINWEVIGTKQGAGNSTHPIHYSYVDENSFRNTDLVYYRLKQTDYNGRFEYFNPISVSNCASEANLVVYPNPVSDVLYIKTEDTDDSYHALLYGADGKLIFEEQLSNQQTNLVNIADLVSGVYTLILFNKTTTKKTVKKIIVQ